LAVFEASDRPDVLAEPVFNAFPAGSQYGTLLHDLLEWQFERGWPIAKPAAPSAAPGDEWQGLMQRKAQRLKLDPDPCLPLHAWLGRIVQTELPLASCDSAASVAAEAGPRAESRVPPAPLLLCALDRHTAWAEMAFTLPVHAFSATRLDALTRQHVLPGRAGCSRCSWRAC
jgi:exodeoxyribonuclease V beta subunit